VEGARDEEYRVDGKGRVFYMMGRLGKIVLGNTILGFCVCNKLALFLHFDIDTV